MFKAKIEIDKFDDYMKLVSQGSEKTIIKEPVEKIVEITKVEDPICPYCGGKNLKFYSYENHSVFLNGNKEIPTQSASIMCEDCNMVHVQHSSIAHRYMK